MSTSPALSLRPFRRSDVPFFAELAGDERVTRFVGDGEPWQEPAIAARSSAALKLLPVEQAGAARWFIAESHAGGGAEDGAEDRAPRGSKPVGLVVSTRRTDGVEIGYWVSPGHWGQGIAGAMVDLAVLEIPGVFRDARLIARVDRNNTVSAGILSRRGFTRDAVEDGIDRYRRNGRPTS